MATDGFHIFYNREFTEGLSEPELVFALAHELLHVVLGHVDRRGARDPKRWNVAADLAINIMLGDLEFTLPSGVLHHAGYRGQTAEGIYDQLLDAAAERLSPGRFSPTSAGHHGGGSAGASFDVDWRSFDEHIHPEDPRAMTLPGTESVSKSERASAQTRLAAEFRFRIPGRLAGSLVEELSALANPEVPWTVLLSRFVSGLRRNDYRLYPFNRKHLWRGLYLPSVGVPGPEHLVVAVDTSGSMRSADLIQVMAELDGLRSHSECALTVVQFDAKIQRVDRFEPWEPAVPGKPPDSASTGPRWLGRGGTDLRAPFDWLKSQGSADAIIVMTDGYGPMPDSSPSIPTLWIAMPDSVPEFPFGSVVRLTGGGNCPTADTESGQNPTPNPSP